LLEHKIDVNASSNEMKRTPLHEAVLSNKINHVKLLIKYGANPNLQDVDGNTAAHFAADLSCFEVFSTLMESTIRLNLKLKNHQQMTVIDCIRDKNMFSML
jgi:ankyrin repeat protein